jgi:hypothetical protein
MVMFLEAVAKRARPKDHAAPRGADQPAGGVIRSVRVIQDMRER